MTEMMFIESPYPDELTKKVNEALDLGFEYLEVHYAPTSGGGTYMMVVLRKD